MNSFKLKPDLATVSEKLQAYYLWIILGVISLLGLIALAYSTRFGLGLVNDSAAYVNGAENLQLGNGYMRTSGAGELKPITHFPPFFSLVLAILTRQGGDFLRTAHILILSLYAVDIFLVGVLVFWICQSKLFAILGALTFALSETFLGVYAYLLSEPIFITLMLLAFLLLWRYLVTSRLSWLLLTGITSGLAYLTRFSAVSIFFTIIFILICIHRPLKQIITSILVYLTGSIPFVIGLWAISTSQSTEFGNRQILVHLIPAGDLFEALKNLLSWAALDVLMDAHIIFGWILSAFSLLFLPALIILVIRWMWKAKINQEVLFESQVLLATLATHIFVYFSFLLVSISFYDASTPLDDRILSILYIPTLILLFSGIPLLFQKIQSKTGQFQSIQPILMAGLLIFVILNSVDGVRAAEQLGRDGLGLNHSGWRESQAIQYVRSLPAQTIYSNRPTAIYLLTGRSSYILPTQIDPVTTTARSSYQDDVELMKMDIQKNNGILVFFMMPAEEVSTQWIEEITEGLTLIKAYDYARIYGAP
jgi:hypothetical protein